MPIKALIKKILPAAVLTRIRSQRTKREVANYGKLTPQQVFSKIYAEKVWGDSKDQEWKFFSGTGSHSEHIVSAYVTAVRSFLSTLSAKPDVVDLGCGDFRVGSSIRGFCRNYIAADVVPELIEFNRDKYRTSGVDFRLLDIAQDALPAADVAFIRQVFQHLSNDHVLKALPKIADAYKYLVVTEHVPSVGFEPNLDKPAGPETRLHLKSGVVLTRPPFNLKVKEECTLCEIQELDGLIRTTLFRLS